MADYADLPDIMRGPMPTGGESKTWTWDAPLEPERVVCRWRDIPRLWREGEVVRIGRTWAGWKPYIEWPHTHA